MGYNNSRLSNPASKCLRALLKKEGNKEIAKTVFSAGTWNEWERRAIEPQLR